jgi:GxxExxY protein
MNTGARIVRSPDSISREVIGAAMKVHTAVGPGLLESAYEAFLSFELQRSGLSVQSQVAFPAVYEGVRLELGYRVDLLVENLVIVELKSVEAILPVHKAQLLSYLRLNGKSLGLLINFHVEHLKDGIRRVVNGYGWK